MKICYFIVVVLLLLPGCFDTPEQIDQSSANSRTIGVLVVKDADPDSQLVLRNHDGSVWKRFALNPKSRPDQFRPLRSEWRSRIDMRVVSRDSVFYQIILNEKNMSKKYILGGPNLIFFDWEAYLLNSLISLPDGVLLYSTPDMHTTGRPGKNDVYGPVEVEEQWMKVTSLPDAALPDSGWVKWRTVENRLRIEFRR